jgi:hypothetical protein
MRMLIQYTRHAHDPFASMFLHGLDDQTEVGVVRSKEAGRGINHVQGNNASVVLSGDFNG